MLCVQRFICCTGTVVTRVRRAAVRVQIDTDTRVRRPSDFNDDPLTCGVRRGGEGEGAREIRTRDRNGRSKAILLLWLLLLLNVFKCGHDVETFIKSFVVCTRFCTEFSRCSRLSFELTPVFGEVKV